MIETAIRMTRTEGTSCVVIREGKIARTADGRGISPLLAIYHEQPQLLAGAQVVDRIIGKAAAMILTAGGVASVYGDVMSTAARDYLTGRGIEARHGRCVEVITGRGGTGICPIEQSVLEIDDPAEGIAALSKRLDELRRAM